MTEEKAHGLEMGLAFYNYLRQGHGFCCNFVFLVLATSPAIIIVLFRMFVTHWISTPFSQQALPHWRVSLGIYVPIILIGGGVASILVANTFLTAGSGLHNKMLERLARAPMSFFVSHPIGRLLNRFSKDTATADSVLVKQLLLLLQVSFLSFSFS